MSEQVLLQDQPPGIYVLIDDEEPVRVYDYEDGDFGLEEVPENFGIGSLRESDDEDFIRLAVSRKDLRRLKVLADAYSFDYEEGFIEMCLALYRYIQNAEEDPIVFVANF